MAQDGKIDGLEVVKAVLCAPALLVAPACAFLVLRATETLGGAYALVACVLGVAFVAVLASFSKSAWRAARNLRTEDSFAASVAVGLRSMLVFGCLIALPLIAMNSIFVAKKAAVLSEP